MIIIIIIIIVIVVIIMIIIIIIIIMIILIIIMLIIIIIEGICGALSAIRRDLGYNFKYSIIRTEAKTAVRGWSPYPGQPGLSLCVCQKNRRTNHAIDSFTSGPVAWRHIVLIQMATEVLLLTR